MLNKYRRALSSVSRSSVKAIAPTCLFIVFLEVTLRLGTFLWYDFSQYYLYYGFHNLAGKVGISPWSTYDSGYYKFPPHYLLHGAAGQSSHETALINSLGFRGPDFQPSKPKNTFRIICMGGSSTFGFHNTDLGTYPYQLGELFKKKRGDVRVEVINAGFPYYNTGSILSLLKEELLDYEPDVLTLYSAYNDAGWPLHVGKLTRLEFWVYQHSITYSLMKNNAVTKAILEYVAKFQRRISRNLPFFQNISTAELDEHVTQVAMRYRKNVEAVIAIARSKGIPVIVITQPMTTQHYRIVHHMAHFDSYEEEYNAIMNGFKQNGRLSNIELLMIVHHRLIMDLKNIAQEENVPIIDNIAIVDQDRERFASYVHLTEEANARLAEAIKGVIEPYVSKRSARVLNAAARP